ncbi:hypothetical protein G9A89_008090 [Geosiphon pyriformis]|nr:hypothetical protein G9A89_008090 [Geosiphon pyriformis]
MPPMDAHAEVYPGADTPDDSTVCHLVLDYLVYNCYGETAKAFLKDREELLNKNIDTTPNPTNGISKNGTKTNGSHNGNGFVTSAIPMEMSDEIDVEGDSEMVDLNGDDPMHVDCPLTNGDSKAASSLKILGSKESDAIVYDATSIALKSLDARKQIRDLIISGDIHGAILLCQATFPRVISADLDDDITTPRSIEMCFKLQCQQFVEFIRGGDANEALTFAQSVLTEFPLKDKLNEQKYLKEIEEIAALIAYLEPETSPVGAFLAQDHRDRLADEINSAILYFYSLPSESGIERIVRQATVVRDYLQDDASLNKRTGNKVFASWQLSTFIQDDS